MDKKIPVGVLAATGAVGQRFVQLLENHPWFKVVAVTGSERTVGRSYAEGVNWVIPGDPPTGIRNLIVQESTPALDVPVVFSALPTAKARQLEPKFAEAGHIVVTNASPYRMAEFVPLLIPEINPDHTQLIKTQQAQRGWSGFIVASPNCAVTSVILPLKVFHDAFGVQAAIITTMQALSGAGYPGVPSLAIQDNVIPHIGGEENKLEEEPKKFLGTVTDGKMKLAEIKLSAQTNRVPVLNGHLVSATVKLDHPPKPETAIEVLERWQPPAICNELPSSPDRPLIYRREIDRPQPRLDRDNEGGLAWTVGKVRACNVLDLRFMAISHNTLRGAASGSILNAELLKVQGFLKA